MENRTGDEWAVERTVPDVMAAYQLLRAAQDAEARALEAMLLHQVDPPRSEDVTTAEASIERAIAQHEAASEELVALKEFRSDGDE